MIYYKSWLFIEKTSDDVTKTKCEKLWDRLAYPEGPKASANREPKISLLVQIGYKHKQRYAQMTPYKSFQIGRLDRS